MGNSPALNHVDLSLLDDIFTIGVNRILRVYNPDVVLLVDVVIMKQERESLEKHDGKLFMWEGMRKHQKIAEIKFPNALYFKLSSLKEVRENTWAEKPPGPIRRVGTTPPYALQLAVLAGCNPIGVIGVDHTANNPGKNEKTHFYGNGRREGSTGGGPFTGRNEDFWKSADTWAKSHGTSIYNLTPFDDSPFNASGLSRMSLKDFSFKAKSGGFE
jgi:hypothetical protein